MSPIDRRIDQFLLATAARLRERGAKARPYWHAGPPRFCWHAGPWHGRVTASAEGAETVLLDFGNRLSGGPHPAASSRRGRTCLTRSAALCWP
jgi:hypothetical protein